MSGVDVGSVNWGSVTWGGVDWSAIDWGGADVVLACQLICALTLATHLLVLRPRAARQDLLLDARVVQDELDLAERLGHVNPANVETIAVQQLLRRIRQNPRSAGLVLERIPALAQAAEYSTRPTDVEYLGGALDRLSDAAQRYLRGAWPRAGALPVAITGTGTIIASPPIIRSRGAIEDGYRPEDAADSYGLADDLYLADDSEFDDFNDLDFNDLDDDELDSRDDLDGQADPDDSDDPDAEPAGGFDDGSPATDAVPPAGSGAASGSPRTGQVPVLDLSTIEWSPSWVDLVKAETPRRNSGLGLADRHARPYRPARSSGHSAARRAEQPDRSSVLPR